ncbi:hypothetical protein NDU88_005626 [Pleurodeles waltl]|uniref:Uncharacterized protein n=1 Tax=Pleurodeles waltl TaxID=8319 RepID=A0AAV7UIR2_PLEWA|nr:hypothetical protein NDU88_005626 [Pleurodeles waltl]
MRTEEKEHLIEKRDDIIQYTALKKVKGEPLRTSSGEDCVIPQVLHTSPSSEHSTAVPNYTPPLENIDEDPLDTVWDKLCTSLEDEMYDAQHKDDILMVSFYNMCMVQLE